MFASRDLGLIVVNDHIVVSSLRVAETFDKEHKNVLQAIENLECSQAFRRLNFQPSEYLNSQGKMMPEYMITRDGFSMLGMAFTGAQAARFREAYIEAFNTMDAELRKRHISLPSDPLEIARLALAAADNERTLRLVAENRAGDAELAHQNLREQIGESGHWWSVGRVLQHYDLGHLKPKRSVIGKALKRISIGMGLEVRRVPSQSPHYDSVCIYQTAAVEAWYASLPEDMKHVPPRFPATRLPNSTVSSAESK